MGATGGHIFHWGGVAPPAPRRTAPVSNRTVVLIVTAISVPTANLVQGTTKLR